jgi:cysteinyl-tRNA synthetase
LWEAYEALKKLEVGSWELAGDPELETKVLNWLNELEEFMDEDLSTPKVIANLFELAPIINSLKDGLIKAGSISSKTLELMKEKFKIFLEDILGLQNVSEADNAKLQGLMDLLIDIRKESKTKKDFATSDKIRKQLTEIGISLKDEKDGGMSWTVE